jgi:glycerate kinase
VTVAAAPATRRVVAAPDKFRGTASAGDVTAAVARAAVRSGWTADEVPMSDGGEGLLAAVGGEPRHTEVAGPLGAPVVAEWRFLPAGPGRATPLAVIEMAEASGRARLLHPRGDEPMVATTAGTGQLILEAVGSGARQIVVGCGGSATTDGGLGAVEAIGSPTALRGATLVAAVDVTTSFTDAARLFGPQKGAAPDQVEELTERLGSLAARYRSEFAVDVTTLAGAGAAGGLAGGLAALGGTIEPGFDLTARIVDLPARLAGADLVVTGEGHLDVPSFAGKVVGGVLALVASPAGDRPGGRVPVLLVVGDADPEALDLVPEGTEVARLVAVGGERRARLETVELIEQIVGDRLARG